MGRSWNLPVPAGSGQEAGAWLGAVLLSDVGSSNAQYLLP